MTDQILTTEQKKHLEDLENWITFLQSHKEALKDNILKKLYKIREEIDKLIKMLEDYYS